MPDMPVANEVEPMITPQNGEKEKLDVKVERIKKGTKELVKIGETFSVEAARLREVRFDRKDRGHFKVIVQTFNEGSGVFTPYSGISNNVIGVIEAGEVSKFKSELEQLHIKTLYLSL